MMVMGSVVGWVAAIVLLQVIGLHGEEGLGAQRKFWVPVYRRVGHFPTSQDDSEAGEYTSSRGELHGGVRD
ncbi:hypothetical protein RchiOBHm_Chr4g0389951 [Rosa chinensis]|uniref:Uncharacterized protein n=1 Tax=Rosa chinensis TaxID=74649 RepID=A0A2P6QQ39_ROSCH|nr:hypothetical protein RchiOBHm_Chr4g0389951 [Rosa chinensis]